MPSNPIVPNLIDRGATADNGQGDPLRTGAGKINANVVDLAAEANDLRTMIGNDIGDTTILGSTLVAILTGLQQAGQIQFARELVWSPDEQVFASPALLATQDLDITSVQLVIDGAPPTSTGTLLLSVVLDDDGTPIEILSGGPQDIEGQAVGVSSRTLIGSIPTWEAGRLIEVSLTSDEDDLTAGGISVIIVAEPA
jgi:hypothetical protein